MISEKDALNKIKSKGYWNVIIHPTKYQKRFTPMEAKSLLEKISIQYYGWSVPIITNKSEQCFFSQGYVEGIFDNYGVIEVWRFYTSGQLVYLRGFIEDWQKGNWYTGFQSRTEGKMPTKVKGIGVTVNEVTMFYQLAHQMIETGKFGDKLIISIALQDVQDRTLATDSPMATLYDDYTCRIATITMNSKFTKKELTDFAKLAMIALLEITMVFNWSREERVKALEQHQQKYLSGS